MITVGRVEVAGGVASERTSTGGRVCDAGGVEIERTITQKRVEAAEIAALSTTRSRLRRKRKAGQHYGCESGTNNLRCGFHVLLLLLGLWICSY
jgi:hypothetical protein